MNGDGYDDVVLGAYGYNSYTGRAYLYLGSATGLSSTAATTLDGETTSSMFGVSVASAGDVNGDGYDDVVVGATYYNSQTGRAYVFTGSATGLSSTAATTLDGETTSSYFGYSAAGAGDVNGDGYDDVGVGAYGYNSFTGRAYLYLGSASGLSSFAVTTLDGELTLNYFGYSVAGTGDVNGDGYDDVVLGAYGYNSYTGRAYVYPGSASGLSSTAATTLNGETTNKVFGYSVAGAGDVNGDGHDDVVVGAPYYNDNTGRAYVYLGYTDLCYLDSDGDGSGSTTSVASPDGTCPAGYSDDSNDCDDTDASINPATPEIIDDGIDQDCDTVDSCYADSDGDGFGTTPMDANDLDCTDTGEASTDGDCDDALPTTYPGATEIPADGIDQDCDGDDNCYVDDDSDDFGVEVVPKSSPSVSNQHSSNELQSWSTPSATISVAPGWMEALLSSQSDAFTASLRLLVQLMSGRRERGWVQRRGGRGISIQLGDRPRVRVPGLGERPVEHRRDHYKRGNKR